MPAFLFSKRSTARRLHYGLIAIETATGCSCTLGPPQPRENGNHLNTQSALPPQMRSFLPVARF